MAYCGVVFPPCVFGSWVDSSFSEDSWAVLRPSYICWDSSQETLRKIYLPATYPLVAKGTVLH